MDYVDMSEVLSTPIETCVGPLYLSTHSVKRFKERVLCIHPNIPLTPWQLPILAGMLAAARKVESYKHQRGVAKLSGCKKDLEALRKIKHGEKGYFLGVPYTPDDLAGWLFPYVKGVGEIGKPTLLTIFPVRRLQFFDTNNNE